MTIHSSVSKSAIIVHRTVRWSSAIEHLQNPAHEPRVYIALSNFPSESEVHVSLTALDCNGNNAALHFDFDAKALKKGTFLEAIEDDEDHSSALQALFSADRALLHVTNSLGTVLFDGAITLPEPLESHLDVSGSSLPLTQGHAYQGQFRKHHQIPYQTGETSSAAFELWFRPEETHLGDVIEDGANWEQRAFEPAADLKKAINFEQFGKYFFQTKTSRFIRSQDFFAVAHTYIWAPLPTVKLQQRRPTVEQTSQNIAITPANPECFLITTIPRYVSFRVDRTSVCSVFSPQAIETQFKVGETVNLPQTPTARWQLYANDETCTGLVVYQQCGPLNLNSIAIEKRVVGCMPYYDDVVNNTIPACDG